MPTARLALLSLLLFAGCASPPPPPAPESAAAKPRSDPTREPAYQTAVEQLARLNSEIKDLLARGRSDEAAATITRGQPIQAQLLAASRPTLPAMEAISDLDAHYARMLLTNGHDGWARLFFQKNVARWKVWEPQTEDTARRLREAQTGIAECDRRLK